MTSGWKRAWQPWVGHGLILLGAIALIWANVWYQMHRDYQAVVAATVATTGNLARVVEAMTLRKVASVDRTLLITRDLFLRDPAHVDLDIWARNRFFLDDPSIQLSIADADGRVLMSAPGPDAEAVGRQDRAFFAEHTPAWTDRLLIGQPVVGRLSGRISVQFTRPILDASGSFGGVVTAWLDVDAFGRLIDAVGIGDVTIQLVGVDGTVWAGGLPAPDPLLMVRARAQPAGHYRTGGSDRDGTIVSFRRLNEYGLIVAVGAGLREALADQAAEGRRAVRAGLGLTLLCGVISVAVICRRRRDDRRLHALAVTLETIGQGVMLIDRNGRMPVINRRAAALLGLRDTIAKPDGKFGGISQYQMNIGVFSSSDAGKNLTGPVAPQAGIDACPPVHEQTRPDGTVLEVRTTVLPDGAAVRTVTDITERKRIEQELATARDAACRAQAGLRLTPAHGIDAPRPEPQVSAKLRILVADDDATSRLVTTRMIAGLGHAADAVEDGVQAIEALRRQPYDVVLMDRMMPGMDGLAASREIRATAAPFSTTPIICLTANASAEDERACRDAGMNGFLTKPVGRDRLMDALRSVLPQENPPPEQAPDAAPDPGRHPADADAGAPVLDTALLSDLQSAIGTEGVREALTLFLEDGPPHVAAIARHFDAAEITALRREAHALAGIAKAVGLLRLAAVADHLQRAAEASQPDLASVTHAATLLAEAEQAIRAWLDRQPQAVEPTGAAD